MTMGLGHLLGSAIFIAIFLAFVSAQIAATQFHRWLYWLVIVATTTAGTTMADLAGRSLGISYAGGSAILAALLVVSLVVWHRPAGSVSIATITTPRIEIFYWVTILFSQTLGTALGDWMADTTGLGDEGGALVFAAGLATWQQPTSPLPFREPCR